MYKRFKARVCARSLSGSAGLNPAGVMVVSLLWELCVVCYQPIPPPQESYRMCCVYLSVIRKTSRWGGVGLPGLLSCRKMSKNVRHLTWCPSSCIPPVTLPNSALQWALHIHGRLAACVIKKNSVLEIPNKRVDPLYLAQQCGWKNKNDKVYCSKLTYIN